MYCQEDKRMRKMLSPYQIELLDFVTSEKKKGLTFSIAFNKFASMKKSSASKVQNDWYNVDNGIVRRTYNVEQGQVEKSIPVRSSNFDNRVKYSDDAIKQALEYKKTMTYKEVEKVTGVKAGTLKAIIRDNNAQKKNIKPIEENKKKGVKASELLSSIQDVKNEINQNLVEFQDEIFKQINLLNNSFKSDINGLLNTMKIISANSHSTVMSTPPSNKYIVDRDSSVRYLGEHPSNKEDEKVDKLMKMVDELESELDSKNSVLEDRREESKRLSEINRELQKKEQSLTQELESKNENVKLLQEKLTSLQEENSLLRSRGVFKRLINA